MLQGFGISSRYFLPAPQKFLLEMTQQMLGPHIASLARKRRGILLL